MAYWTIRAVMILSEMESLSLELFTLLETAAESYETHRSFNYHLATIFAKRDSVLQTVTKISSVINGWAITWLCFAVALAVVSLSRKLSILVAIIVHSILLKCYDISMMIIKPESQFYLFTVRLLLRMLKQAILMRESDACVVNAQWSSPIWIELEKEFSKPQNPHPELVIKSTILLNVERTYLCVNLNIKAFYPSLQFLSS